MSRFVTFGSLKAGSTFFTKYGHWKKIKLTTCFNHSANAISTEECLIFRSTLFDDYQLVEVEKITATIINFPTNVAIIVKSN